MDALIPNIIKRISIKALTDWQKNNSDSLFSIGDLSSLNPLSKGIILTAYQYNKIQPQVPEGYMRISPYYYFSNKYYLELKKEFEPVQGLSLKALAAISGLGYYGKNTLIHNESFGSAMFLYAYETFEDMEWDELISSKDYMDFSDCKECRKCVDACPTGALDSNYKLNRVKCMRNYMLEGILVPEDIKPFMEDRLLGCDICQQACPKNQITTKTYLMPSFEELQAENREAFIVENYIKNKDRGFKKYMNSLSLYIGKNYARSKRVLEQCEIIYDNIKK